MRRYQKWLTVGLLALTPGISLAGPMDSPLLKQSTTSRSQLTGSQPLRKSKADSNQETANRIHSALSKIDHKGCEIEVLVQDGVATLEGTVRNKTQRDAAAKAAKVAGVTKVNNRLALGEPKPAMAVQQAAFAARRGGGRSSQPVRQINAQSPMPGIEPLPLAPVPASEPLPQSIAQGVARPVSQPTGMPPGYCPPNAAGSNAIYNQPNLPNQSWPTYAQHPNYAAVSYPAQHSASAWPYVGPFYPYPQVPLGWRKAALEWDDGYWNLNFRARTDHWWWYLDPKNW